MVIMHTRDLPLIVSWISCIEEMEDKDMPRQSLDTHQWFYSQDPQVIACAAKKFKVFFSNLNIASLFILKENVSMVSSQRITMYVMVHP
jgi:hypothetical protein